MRMKNYILLIVFLSFYTGLIAKDHSRKIQWHSEIENNYAGAVASFDGAYINEYNLPVYIENISLKKGERIELVNLNYEIVDIENDSQMLTKLPEKLSVLPQYVKSNGEKVALLDFIPLVYKEGELKKLVSFDIKIVNDPALKSAEIQNSVEWKSSSVLASGKWVKVKTDSRGIYKIPFSALQNEYGFTNPSEVKLYGNGGYMLPKMNDDFFYDDLEQIAIWHGNANGEQNLFFYSTGTVKWEWDENDEMFRHIPNDYSDVAYYYLSDVGTSKFVEQLPEETAQPTHTINEFVDYIVHEQDQHNLIESGRRWFGEQFGQGYSRTVSFTLEDPSQNNSSKILVEAAARSSSSSSLSVAVSGSNPEDIEFQSVNVTSVESLYADLDYRIYDFENLSSSFDVGLQYKASNNSSSAWLDFIVVNYTRQLNVNDQLIFRDNQSVGGNNVTSYQLGVSNSELQIWDITDYLNPKSLQFSSQGNQVSLKSSSETLKEFIAFYPGSQFPEPEKVEDVENQNLHASNLAEFIIITHPKFINQANELAGFHRQLDGMDVQVVLPEKIYNEFSSGIPDISGIRNFLRMCYERSNPAAGLKYVLFYGDGSFDNKDILGYGNNLIPTYQSANSLLPTSSFVTDDFFALLDEGEGEYSGLIDLGIGRIPCRTTAEAETVVDKIKNYVDTTSLGDWRNVVCFIGDDEDNPDFDYHTHVRQANNLANYAEGLNPGLTLDKIYFDAYIEEVGPGGQRYPGVEDAIKNRVDNGALILNYTGHANTTAMSDERVLGLNDIDSWSNYNQLPIFVTATCEISRFDLAEENSAGEHILFNPNGGGIGLFSTTRVVFSGPNFAINKEFYEHVFSQDENGENLRMGEIMRRTKNGVTGTNKRNFTLLGDPALKLAYPKFKVVTETINDKSVEIETDTISSLSTVTIKGYVADHLGNKLDDFNGELIPIVYDKAQMAETLGNGGERPFEFKVQNNIIYKGVTSVSDGDFEFTFIVPKDISYSVAPGKISYYADNGQDDAHGYSEDFYIGGSSGIVIDDNEGPEIELFLNDTTFQDGDVVGKNPVLIARVSDIHGINTVGTGIGHDITAVIDDDYSNIIVLNDFYLADKDSYQSGEVIYPLRNITVGEHTLRFKVWDVLNNSSEVLINFKVTADLEIVDVWCYPNPVTDYTNFQFAHNRSDETMDTRIEIFDMTGGLLDVVLQRQGSSRNTSFPILWQVNNSTMLYRSGTYLFRITIDADDGASASKTGRMVISKY